MALSEIDIPNLSAAAREYYFKGTVRTPLNGALGLDVDAGFQYQVIDASFITAAGTLTAAVQINNGAGWASVTGLDAVAVSTTKASVTATAANTVNEDGRLRLNMSSVVDAASLEFSIRVREVV